MPQTEPVPPSIGRLNLGIILETPFLHQTLMKPNVFNAKVESTALPNKTSESTAAFTYLGPELVLNEYSNETSEKRTEYHYTPSDPSEMIAAIEKEIAKLKVERKEVSEKVEATAYKNRIKLLELDINKLKRMKKQGGIPMKLVRTSFHEKRIEADIEVDGEMIFEYEGPNIVKGTTTTKTNEDPPKVAEVIRKYKYNFMGQLTEMDLYDCLTKYTYDPLFRLAAAECNFISPMGDFVSKDKTVYTYAPPGSDPIPANALIQSVTDAYSGPEMEMDKVSNQPPKLGDGSSAGGEGKPTDAAPLSDGIKTVTGSSLEKAGDKKPSDPASWLGGLKSVVEGLVGAKEAVESSESDAEKPSDLAQWGEGIEAASEGLQDAKTAVGEQPDAMAGAGKLSDKTVAVAEVKDPCAALAMLDFEFELPKVTVTKVVGTYVYG